MHDRFASALSFTLTASVTFLVAVTSLGAEPGPRAYAELLSAEKDLVAWWRFEGDLNDAEGAANAVGHGGRPQFDQGPSGGKALLLNDRRFVTMGDTPQLDLRETTVELWFKPEFSDVNYNPCIIAKRADGDNKRTRFSLHIWQDYSCLAVWNGRRVMRYRAADGPLRRGQWYHVAITCAGLEVRVYVDGVACGLDGVPDGFNFDQVKLPLSIGSSQPGGAEFLDCSVDEVAVYRRALSEEEIALHVDAMGRRERRLELAAARREQIEKEKEAAAAREARRQERCVELMSDPALFARGEPFVYQGEHLRAISLTVGGIGTGSIQIDGRAVRSAWQIFNNHRHAVVPHSFFAVRVAGAGKKPVLRALQTAPAGPLAAMQNLSFCGEYPFGWYRFEDPDLPAEVTMETFNPLVPLEVESSAIPCAVFNLSAANRTDQPLAITFLATQQNAVGYQGEQPIDGRAYAGYGGNSNEIIRDAGTTLLHMTSSRSPGAPGAGDMVLMATSEGVTATASWETLEELAASFASRGVLSGADRAGPSPAGKTIDGALAVGFTLAPGESRTVPFVLTWHFPNARHGSRNWGGEGNMYSNLWPDALAVAHDLQKNLDELTRKTRLYHDSLYASNLPRWLLDRISSQVAVLRSRTCFWTAAGYFGGWEGCCPESGCCKGNCNHVWHYAQAHARLFPSIARLMRQQEFQCQEPSGSIPFRQPEHPAAFDGQCGAVLNSYREHLISADDTWLAANWPHVKKAMDFLITTWDEDEDGVLAGPQWNTLDGALGGSTSWLGTMYLAALAAAERMALCENEPEAAERYARIRMSGSKKQDETLFNGEYYIQIPDPEPNQDYATGCHIDQVLGQWWAHQLDLGWLYPPERVRTALGSLFKYNFRGELDGLPQVPRKFVADYDPGMQMITWPKGPRPPKVIRYGDEVMTGFEYAAAAAMVQAGLLREGFTVVRAIWIRYDGRRREDLTPSRTASWGYSGNPFGDDECGKFYARAMSVWSMLLACQGFIYDGPAGSIGFKPVWRPEDHASFFTAAEGWGVFHQRREPGTQTERIELRYGRLRIRLLIFELPEQARPGKVDVKLRGRPVPAAVASADGEIRVTLEEPAVLEAADEMTVTIGVERAR